jgi:hypothetical protein
MYRIRLNNDHSKNESDRWYVNANFDIFRHFRLLLETVNHCVSDVRRAMDCLKVRHLCFYIYSPGVVCTLKSIRLEVDFNDSIRVLTSTDAPFTSRDLRAVLRKQIRFPTSDCIWHMAFCTSAERCAGPVRVRHNGGHNMFEIRNALEQRYYAKTRWHSTFIVPLECVDRWENALHKETWSILVLHWDRKRTISNTF